MLFLTILTVLLVTCCAYTVWPSLRGLRTEGDESHPSPGAAAAAAPARSRRPESLEGVLVAQLASDQITQRQYRREMERIAARDDERHPLAVPPETGSDAGL